MKKLILLLITFISFSAKATDVYWYYAYFETEYVQGPWNATKLFETAQYKYLEPKMFDISGGSDRFLIINDLLSQLEKDKPKLYKWDRNLDWKGDTLVIATKQKIQEFETVKNEITASAAHMMGINYVTFSIMGKKNTYSLNDITLPYLELVKNGRGGYEPLVRVTDTVKQIKHDTIQTSSQPIIPEPIKTNNSEESRYNFWLIISIAINVLLLLFLFIKKVRK